MQLNLKFIVKRFGVFFITALTSMFLVAAEYTWTGAVDGNFSTPGNWSVNDEAVNDVPGVLDTIRFAPEAATTVTLDADVQVAAMVIEGSGALTLANPSAATTNTLTLASVTSSATVVPVINCRVQFTDKYTVSFTSKAVKFAGGATATTWDLSNTALSPTSELTGNITFTGTLTAPSAQAWMPLRKQQSICRKFREAKN